MFERPSTMRGVQLIGHGGLDQLAIRDDLPVPVPAPGEVLVRVAAAGVNNTDLNTRIGWYSKSDGAAEDAGWGGSALQLPRIQGADVCGEIVELGEGVDASRLGERVIVEPCLVEAGGAMLDSPWYLGSEVDGGFAEYMVIASRHAFRVACALSDAELASFPCSYSTAENMLTRAGVGAGDHVFVTGASGGVGSAVVQLARARGARVTAAAGRDKTEQVAALGAERVLDRSGSALEALGKNAVDVVVDLVAGHRWPELLEVLRPFGRYTTAGAIAGPIVELDVRTLYLKDQTLIGCTVLDAGVFAALVHRIEAGEIAPLVARTFALEAIVEAQQVFETKQHVGKLVLDVTGPASTQA